MRFIAAEVIREQILLHTEQEIPYSCAVEVDGYKEGEERTSISGIIYVERESQKGMVIGKHGAMIKTIGSAARQELMTMLEVPVHLELHVKVLKNWRDDEALMRRLGYRMPKPEDDKD
jgi:GTP-binding protein Era